MKIELNQALNLLHDNLEHYLCQALLPFMFTLSGSGRKYNAYRPVSVVIFKRTPFPELYKCLANNNFSN